jgi:hypothetical protein
MYLSRKIPLKANFAWSEWVEHTCHIGAATDNVRVLQDALINDEGGKGSAA